MDIDVSGWILEFLIQQKSIDDRTLNDIIRVLPLPNNNPKLKKSLILRQIDSDIEKGKISERTIELLERIEQLNVIEGNNNVSESMKAAYCYVAMHCTAKLINEIDDNDNDNDKKEKYVSAVKRIWSGRINAMERCDVVGLVQDDLLTWVHDVEDGVLDLDVFENVLEMFKELDVFNVLRRYVNEEKLKMGPSFLERACETVMSDDSLREVMGWDADLGFDNGVKDGAPSVVPAVSKEMNDNVSKKGNESLKDNVVPKNKHVSPRHNRISGHGTRRGAKIVDPLETSQERYNYISTPEVNKVQEALETSSFELHAMVTDPLPDALRLPESFMCNTSRENMANENVVGSFTRVNEAASNSSLDKKGKALDANGDDDLCRDQNKRQKPTLMERNNTAHTVEWSDSIDDSSEDRSPTRPHLPSPKKRVVSPLNVYKMEKLARQRKKRRWSILEEDTLRTGVQKYGKGNWKMILNMYRDIFEDRTEVDLKDKWRNLTR